MRYGSKYPRVTPRGPTKRRLAAAKRHLQAERDKLALFADEVAAAQPTPEERIASFDNSFTETFNTTFRQRRAEAWRKARKLRESISPEKQAAVDILWRRGRYPMDPVYLIGVIRRVIDGSLDPVRETEELERLRELGRQKGYRND